MNLKYILLKKILKNSDFVDLNSIIIFNKKIVHVIISYIYKSNTQVCQEK